MKYINNISNNRSIIMTYNHNNIIRENFGKKLNVVRNSNSYYYLEPNIIMNSSKSNNNRSSMNINNDNEKCILNEKFSPIKHRYTLNNKVNNKNCYEKMPTTIELNNKLNNRHKQLLNKYFLY